MSLQRLQLPAATALATIGAMTSFGGLFAGWQWLLPMLGAVLVVITVSELTRRSRIPSAVGPLVAAVSVIAYLTALDAHSYAIAGFIPSAAARHHLSLLLHQGANEIHRYAPPVAARPGVVLLAVIGIAAVTLVVDLCVLTLDRAALAGAPLLSVFIVGAVLTHHGVGVLPFLLAGLGYLCLLGAESSDLRRRWGRTFGTPAGPNMPAMATIGGLGRSIGATAVVIAALVPALIPGLGAGFHDGNGNGAGSGPHRRTAINPEVGLNQQLHQDKNKLLFTYRSTSTDPGYLRLTSLDLFNGKLFSARDLNSNTSISEGQTFPNAGGTVVNTSISIGSLDEPWAPVPAQPVTASIAGNWLFDPATSTLWSASSTTIGQVYQVSSRLPDPSASQLEQAAGPITNPTARADLALPPLPARVSQLARQLVGKNPYDTAINIQNFFTGGNFTYSTDVPGSDSDDALTNFLFTTRKGFCQQFSASMVILARQDGIPARVAIGFTHGTQEANGEWRVTGADAHAWPELWFQGFGWLAFEPTPRGDGQISTPSYAQPQISTAKNHHHKTGSTHPRGGPRPHLSPTPRVHIPTPSATSPGARAKHHSELPLIFALLALAVAVLAFAAPAAARVATRRRHEHPHSPVEAAHAAWDELRDTALDLGVDWPDGLSPRRTATAVLQRRPALGVVDDSLRRVALAEQQARYARDVSVDVGDGLRHDVHQVRAVLLSSADRRERLRATFLPRSSLRATRVRVDNVRLAGATRLGSAARTGRARIARIFRRR